MSEGLRVAVVVGNPKPRSRTYEAAQLVAERLTGAPADLVVDIADLGAGVLDWSDVPTSEAVEAVRAVDVLVVASPTYKAAYTGLLKVFLDRFPSDGLAGVVAVPLMLGAGPTHALAPEHTLRPVLVELGASTPTRGLYLIDRDFANPAVLDPWLARAESQVKAAVAARVTT
ncbi:MAG: NAD(P)H-dependent oxidoreductase [Propionibacteriaceae bacterium]